MSSVTERFVVAVLCVASSLVGAGWARAQAPSEEAEPVTESEPDEGPTYDDPEEPEPLPPQDDPGTASDSSEPDGRGDRGQGDRAAAESLARVGRGLMELGRYDDACPKLEQSIEAHPMGEAALMLGECYERLGRLAAGWAAYRQAAGRFRHHDEAQHEVALTRARGLEPKVPKLTLRSAARVPGMRIQRDETDFGVGVLGVPLAVDPGPHHLEVRAEGYRPWTLDLELQPGERRTVDIPALTVVADDSDVTPSASVARRGHGAPFYAGVITAGAGAASVAAGVLLATSASRDVSAAESSESLCGADRICTPEGRDLVDRADAKAIAATATLVVGAAAIATGFVLVIVDDGQPVPSERTAGPRLDLRPLGGGLALGGRF